MIRQIDSTVDFLLFGPIGTKFSVPGIIIAAGAFYYMFNTCEWRENRRRSKEWIAFYEDALKKESLSEKTRENVEWHLKRLKQYRRDTFFPSFNPPEVPSITDQKN